MLTDNGRWAKVKAWCGTWFHTSDPAQDFLDLEDLRVHIRALEEERLRKSYPELGYWVQDGVTTSYVESYDEAKERFNKELAKRKGNRK